MLWLVATSGNTLGSLINVWMGRYARRFQDRRWFPASPQGLVRAERWYHRFGEWSLLLSWAPVIGDPLTVLAGVFRLPWWRAILLISVAKGRATPWCWCSLRRGWPRSASSPLQHRGQPGGQPREQGQCHQHAELQQDEGRHSAVDG